MGKFNSKTEHIHTTFTASDILTNMTGNKNKNITFLTNFGFVMGSQAELAKLDLKDKETMKKSISIGDEVDVFSLAKGLENRLFEKRNHDGAIHEDEDKIIYLKDVVISFQGHPPIECPALTLFVDQIVGVIPGQISIKF